MDGDESFAYIFSFDLDNHKWTVLFYFIDKEMEPQSLNNFFGFIMR